MAFDRLPIAASPSPSGAESPATGDAELHREVARLRLIHDALDRSISDGVAREHGRRIEVESVPGEGAAFIVELPCIASLDSLGHDVIIAARVRDARRLLVRTAYDDVLLDLRMGEAGGDVLHRELCSRDPRQAARVVFLTGDTRSDSARRFLDDAARPTLSKPFQLDDLAAATAAVSR